jgi:hypothetical protein
MNMAGTRRLDPGISAEEHALWDRVSKACAEALSGPQWLRRLHIVTTTALWASRPGES